MTFRRNATKASDLNWFLELTVIINEPVNLQIPLNIQHGKMYAESGIALALALKTIRKKNTTIYRKKKPEPKHG